MMYSGTLTGSTFTLFVDSLIDVLTTKTNGRIYVISDTGTGNDRVVWLGVTGYDKKLKIWRYYYYGSSAITRWNMHVYNNAETTLLGGGGVDFYIATTKNYKLYVTDEIIAFVVGQGTPFIYTKVGNTPVEMHTASISAKTTVKCMQNDSEVYGAITTTAIDGRYQYKTLTTGNHIITPTYIPDVGQTAYLDVPAPNLYNFDNLDNFPNGALFTIGTSTYMVVFGTMLLKVA